MSTNIFPFVAFVTGEKSFKDILDIVEYPYWLKKRKFWFYPYEGDGCIPVEKYHPSDKNPNDNVWVRIYTKDNNSSKINGLGQEISKLVINLKDGKYIVDTNRMKVVYDLILMESVDCYFSVSIPNKAYNYFLSVSEDHSGKIEEVGRRKPGLIKGGSDLSLVGIAALIGYSNFMITPKTPADFGSGVFKKILEDKLYIPEISSTTYLTSLPEFLIPELKGSLLEGEQKKGIELLGELFEKKLSEKESKKEVKVETTSNGRAIVKHNYNVKLSDIISTGKLPFVTSGKMIINVEVDIQPEGERFLDAYICEEWLYITVDRDPDSLNIKDLRTKIDLNFIVWMPNGHKFNNLNSEYLE